MSPRSLLLVATLVSLFGISSPDSGAVGPEAIDQKRTELREAAQARWQEIKEARQSKLEELKSAVQAKRQEVKAKIQNLRDERKRQVVERIQTKLGQTNQRRSTHFLNVLERLDSILDKIQSRLEKAEAAGKDVADVKAALDEARNKIASARSAVETQKAKAYSITVNDETTARDDAGAAARNLQTDLKAVRELIEAARVSVHDVFEQIKSVVADSDSAAEESE